MKLNTSFLHSPLTLGLSIRTIIELAYDLKKSLGKWYTVFFRIILPFLIYIIPINIIIARTSDWLVSRFLAGIRD